jgi:hypothetical protein
LVMLVLVNLKQATVALFVLVVGAIVLAGLRDPQVRVRDLARLLPAMALPGIVIYVVWRTYVATELASAEMTIRPHETWLIHLIPEIIGKMLLVLSKKGLYLVVMAAAIVFAIRGLVRFRTPFDRLAVIAGALFLGYNAFLLFAYVTTFSKFDAIRVASLWRYNMHLGSIAVAFAAYGLALFWRRHLAARVPRNKLAWLPILLIVAAPLMFTQKLRFDRHPPVPHFRAVGQAVAALVKPGDRLFIVDPTGTGESAMIVRYELWDRDVYRGYMGAFHPRSEKQFRRIFFGGEYSHLLVHSSTPEMLKIIDLPLQAQTSYLLRANGKGGWRIEHAWKMP